MKYGDSTTFLLTHSNPINFGILTPVRKRWKEGLVDFFQRMSGTQSKGWFKLPLEKRLLASSNAIRRVL